MSTFSGLYGVISQTKRLFITTAVRSSNPTTHYLSHCPAMPTYTEDKDKERNTKERSRTTKHAAETGKNVYD
jgi:hypothetical protein